MVKNPRKQKSETYGNMDSFPSFYTQMVGIEAKVLSNTLRRPFIVALHTSEATGKIYAASVHESAKSRVATKKTVYTSPNYMTRQGKVTVLRELPALLT